MTEKTEALRLAEQLEAIGLHGPVAAELRRLAAVEAQRDALLEALKGMLLHMGMDEDEWNKPTFDHARAAIKAVEEEA